MKKNIFFVCIVIFTLLSLTKLYGYETLLDNQGKADTVIKPWTPLKVVNGNNLSIESWGREYVFKNSILPIQIKTQGFSLLSAPITITAKTNGKVLPIDFRYIKILNQSETMVELEGLSEIRYFNRKINIKTNVRIEFDGLMLITLRLNKAKADDIRLSISVPHRNEYADYYIKWERNKQSNYSGRIGDEIGVELTEKFTPYFWIGDNSKGLFWFCETKEYWPLSNTNEAIKIVRKEDRLEQTFNIGSTDYFQFGLQATPVKPMPENWRQLTTSSLASSGEVDSKVVYVRTDDTKKNSVKYFGWPEMKDESLFEKSIESIRQKNQKVILYTAISRLPSNLPLLNRNKNDWIIGPTKMKYKNSTLLYIHPGSKGYADFIAENFSLYLKKYNLNGFYLDGGGLSSQWKSNSNSQHFPILAYRDLHKKLYAKLKKTDPNLLLLSHMSGDMNIPVLAYIDGYVDGEQFRFSENGKLRYKVSESYLDVISLDRFRAEFMGKQWGVIPYFLPEFEVKSRDKIQPSLGLAALLLQHDVHPFMNSSNMEVWDDMYTKLNLFNYQNSTFIGYYESVPPGKSNHKDVLISAYKKGKQSLIIISNLSKRAVQNSSVELNAKILGLNSISSIRNLRKAIKEPISNNSFEVDLDPLSYEMFILN